MHRRAQGCPTKSYFCIENIKQSTKKQTKQQSTRKSNVQRTELQRPYEGNLQRQQITQLNRAELTTRIRRWENLFLTCSCLPYELTLSLCFSKHGGKFPTFRGSINISIWLCWRDARRTRIDRDVNMRPALHQETRKRRGLVCVIDVRISNMHRSNTRLTKRSRRKQRYRSTFLLIRVSPDFCRIYLVPWTVKWEEKFVNAVRKKKKKKKRKTARWLERKGEWFITSDQLFKFQICNCTNILIRRSRNENRP